MVYPLPKPPFLSPMVAYYFLGSRAAALKLTPAVQPLLYYIGEFLQDAAPGIASLGDLNIEDRLAIRRRKPLQDLIPEAPPHP